ncbi:hypothetical protein EsHS_00004892 [Epichloe bromicola]
MHTLRIFNYKIYVSTSNRLLPMIQKQPKTLSFRPFLQIIARKHGDASDETYEIYGGELTHHLSHASRVSLGPGPHLDEQNLRMGNRVLVEVDALLDDAETNKPPSVYLLEWTRHLVVQASSCGVYGNHHPLLDPKVQRAFWQWQNYLTAHLAGLDVFGKGYQLRQTVYDAYIKYCRELPDDGSQLAREHKRVIREAGVNELDYAKQASLFTIAVFSNTAPTLFWTIWELFSRPKVLDQPSKTKCPVLLSVFQETQRTRHVNASFRKVMADTVLDGRYLLKAGNFLQMPGHPIHSNTALWGPDAAEFDPHRFVSDGEKGSPAAVPSTGFVAWGSPPYLCPARQFAAAEVLIATVLLVVRTDLRPQSGVWDPSPSLNYRDLSTLLNPTKDVRIDVMARDQWAGTWSLEMGGSRSRVPLASG